MTLKELAVLTFVFLLALTTCYVLMPIIIIALKIACMMFCTGAVVVGVATIFVRRN